MNNYTAATAALRESLMAAAFDAQSRDAALAALREAVLASDAIMASDPANRDAKLYKAIAIGYRGKLKLNIGDAQTSHRMLDALVLEDRLNSQARLALAGWHFDGVDRLGMVLARTALGAKRAVAEEMLDRAIEIEGGSAYVAAFGALMRIRSRPREVAVALALAESAVAAAPVDALDIRLQEKAARLLPPLRGGEGKEAATLARTLLPFGQLGD